MGFNWPDTIEERPLVQRFDGKTAFFKDGSTHDVDVVLFCTGYLHSYPFLRCDNFRYIEHSTLLRRDELRMKSKNVLYPPNVCTRAWSGSREETTGSSTLVFR